MRTGQRLLLSLSIFVAGCGSTGSNSLFRLPDIGTPTPTPALKATTVLVYMNGSDLENRVRANASENIQEALAAPFPAQANLVYCTGGSQLENPQGPVTSWRTVKRHLLRPGRLQELEDLGSLSMDDPATLTDFIRWGSQKYPARRTMLILWDHGGAYLGFGGDEVNRAASGQPMLRQPQLLEAIRNGSQALGQPFDLIGFDACLMASQEVTSGLREAGNIFVASQEKEPGVGWNWRPLVTALAEQPDIPAQDLGRRIVDSYLATATTEENLTGSVLSLPAVAAVDQAVGELAVQLEQIVSADRNEEVQALLASQLNAYKFAAVSEADLWDWMEQLKSQGLLTREAERVQQAVEGAVLYSRTGPEATRAHGLSLAVPRGSKTYPFRQQYAAVDYLPSYKSLVESIFRWGDANSGLLSLSNLSFNPERTQLSLEVSSRLGIRDVAICASADPPSSTVVRFADISATSTLAQPTTQPITLNLPVNLQRVTWNGHPFPLPEVANQQGGRRNYSLAVKINGEDGFLSVDEDTNSGVFEVGEYFVGDEFDRLRQLRPEDELEVSLQQYNRSTHAIDSYTSERFQAGAMQIQRTPYPAGTYYVYVRARDLDFASQLSSDTLLLP